MNNNYTINADLVRKIYADKGFFYIEAKKCYGEDYVGPELIVATDDKDFLSKHPEYAEMIIVSVDKFIKLSEAVNAYNINERKAIRRQTVNHNDEGYYEDDSVTDERGNPIALRIKDFPMNPVEDEAERKNNMKILIKAISHLKAQPKRRVILYFFKGLTYREIAALEGVSDKSIRESIDGAIKKLKNFF